MTTHRFKPLWLLAAASALAVASSAAVAQSSAASNCPGFSISPTNVAVNPGFELADANVPLGSLRCWRNGRTSAGPAQHRCCATSLATRC